MGLRSVGSEGVLDVGFRGCRGLGICFYNIDGKHI